MKRIFYLYVMFIFQFSLPMQRIITLFAECKNYIKQKNERQRTEWIRGYLSHTQQVNSPLSQVQFIVSK